MISSIWRGWAVLLLTLVFSYSIARWAPEMMAVLATCGWPALLLYHDTSPRRPLWAFRKDRA
jgi:hypothetical protein